MLAIIAILMATTAHAQPPTPKITVTPMPISAAAEPVPALRWKLLPELRETTPGNAAVLYYRAFAPDWWSGFRRDAKNAEALDEAAKMPLAELRAKAGGENSPIGWVRTTSMLKEVDRAARRQYCDWDLVGRAREEGVAMLLPDQQGFREYARMLSVRTRIELADGDYAAACRSLQTGLTLGRQVSDAPTLIQSLVGAAITAVMLNQVEEWVRTPGSPNLYWALTNLPTPFINLKKPLEGERLFVDNLLPGFREALRDPKSAALAPVQLNKLFQDLMIMADGHGSTGLGAFWVMKKYAAAKAYLRENGWSEKQIETLPSMQAVLLADVADYDRLYDEFFKWAGLPFLEARDGFDRAEHALKKHVGENGAPGMSMAGMLLPAVIKVFDTSNRIDRRIAALRCVEAIRLYAAGHGSLPDKLADITEVPVPVDPRTGKPFTYSRDGAKATLTAPPPGLERADYRNSMQYDISLRKGEAK